MQQKYLHEHSLSSNLINNKLREEMYLKHLREVQKINNRQAEQLKKSLKQYHSISELHKKNKIRNNQFKLKQYLRGIQEKNVKIHSKIIGISSDGSFKKNTRYKAHSVDLSQKPEENIQNIEKEEDKSKQKNSLNAQKSNQREKSPKQSFHYRYRKKQQQIIQIQNKKLMKAILTQKSTVLPYINSHKVTNNVRISSQLSKSRTSSQRNNNSQQAH